MAASLFVSFLMLSGKTTAYFITGSEAIFSDAMESVIHLLATGFATFSLWFSIRPADRSHPYGHGKIAYFSSGFEGGLIMIAAVWIIYSAVMDLIAGPELNQISLGLLITFGLSMVNLILGATLIRIGKNQNSVVLIANGQHVLADMWTSLGVVVGLLIVWLTDLLWLDPIVAILVALNILWTALRLIRRSVFGLMEYADPEDTKTLMGILDNAVQGGTIAGFHQLRHRRVDDQKWVEYHLLFPENLSVQEAHARSHLVEDAIHKLFRKDSVVVTAHLEPERHDDAHQGQNQEPGDALANENNFG
ncbi:MAG: cation diffusion facilitator family transporter [Rhodothermia bacterium]|nr:MAG: cation diffusion facilitator family transporter [Rhodothermia bacterium]